jgi:hypothetical protein
MILSQLAAFRSQHEASNQTPQACSSWTFNLYIQAREALLNSLRLALVVKAADV